MADIVLAEFGGNGWLVRGEKYIDDLLANTLPAHVSIEVVTCASKSAAYALWCGYEGGDDPSDMWLIHPAIVRRARGQAPPMSVVFDPWSMALDDRATTTLEVVAAELERRPDRMLALVRYTASAAPEFAADLANLRTGLLEARLHAAGVAPTRLSRETRPATADAQADRIDLVLRNTG